MPQHQMVGPPKPPPGKWSWEALKKSGKRLLADPNQMLSNPLFNAGMGILGENRKPFGGDPFSAAMAGMHSAKATKEQEEDRKRIEELRKRLNQLMRQQMGASIPEIQTGGMGRQIPPGGRPPPGAPPGAPPQGAAPPGAPPGAPPPMPTMPQMAPQDIAARLADPSITDGERMQLEFLQRQMQQQQSGLLGP